MTAVDRVSVSPPIETEEELRASVILRLEQALADARAGKVDILFCLTGELRDGGVEFGVRSVLDYEHTISMMLFIRDYLATALAVDPRQAHDRKNCN